MNIYDYDINLVNEQLTPPVLRKTKLLAWLRVLAVSVERFYINSFIGYKDNSGTGAYNNALTYTLGQLVRHTDKGIYECIVATTIGNAPSSALHWIKVNELFIGADERVKYSSQKKLFEYALNNFFITTGIYIQNRFVNVNNLFLMDTLSAQSSVMPLDSMYQEDYMDDTANAATYSTSVFDYTIFVPIAFYNSLGVNANLIIQTFANKYNLAGMQYNVLSY